MEQKSLRVLEGNKTFFSKVTTTLTKILIPTKLSMNNIMITMKRSSLLKAYNAYTLVNDAADSDKKEELYKKYEDTYTLYLEAIDKYIIDSVYKKVKSGTASNFEREALAKYYTVVALKENQYIEYKHKKQEYLIRIDYDTINQQNKTSLMEKYNEFYTSKMNSLYKGLLRNYSVQLADRKSVKLEGLGNIYDKIFSCLETYITEVLPIRINQIVNDSDTSKQEEYKTLVVEYDRYESSMIGKLDQKDELRKKAIALGVSRVLFTHSLPLIAAEECYIKLIQEARNHLLTDNNQAKRNRTFDIIVDIMEEYNVQLLSTKVYWDKSEERENYKEFWNKYEEIEKTKAEKVKDNSYKNDKQSLFLKYDLRELNKETSKQIEVINFYKAKLVELGVMREILNKCKTIKGKYEKAVCEK